MPLHSFLPSFFFPAQPQLAILSHHLSSFAQFLTQIPTFSTQMMNSDIQNDFSFYKRAIAKLPTSADDYGTG
jgi:hypothetical protein